MARWNDLTKAQQEAIKAFTREAPEGTPNGPEEAAWDEMLAAAVALPHSPQRGALMFACAAVCAASAEKIRHLQIAFGLAEDGVTPVEG